MKLKLFIVGVLLAVYYAVSKTWRLKKVGLPTIKPGAPILWAHWHGDELLLLGPHSFQGMAVMSSRSRDGELMYRALRWLGFFVVRGSSSRGGVGALKGLVDAVRGGRSASIAVDGPRGPRFIAKPGVLKLAETTGFLLIPGAASAARRIVFNKAWNRCYLPLPFTSCVIVYGEPIHVPAGLGPEEFEQFRVRLEGTLRRLKAEAEAHFNHAPENLLLENPVSIGV